MTDKKEQNIYMSIPFEYWEIQEMKSKINDIVLSENIDLRVAERIAKNITSLVTGEINRRAYTKERS